MSYTTIIVSNRLPVSVKKVKGKLVYEASSGGLATAMSSLKADNKIWIGWPGIDSDDLSKDEIEKITKELETRGCRPVFLTHEQTQQYYEGYSNDTIWPLFHYFQSLARYDETYWRVYKEVNKMFAEQVKQVTTADAKVWIQDYHLMLLPQMIRDDMSKVKIGFFLHIPFPSFEIFRLLPQRKDILNGLLGSDVVGFHIYDYGRHFISSCRRLLGDTVSGNMIRHEGRMVKVGAFPIGIDYDKFRMQLTHTATIAAEKQLKDSYVGQKLILSVDRLDYSKGIIDRLEAFRLLLEEHPRYIGKVKLLMIAVPSRTEVDAYQNLRDEVEKIVSRINGTFGTVDWAPISYQFQNRPFPEIVALYSRADIALVTPIRDGMNLVAKEYVASRKKPSGVLVLSEMAGAVDELPEALVINPNDWRSIKSAIVTALSMPKKEQANRMASMQKRLKVATVQNWGAEFMEELEKVSTHHDAQFKKRLLPPEARQIVTKFRAASHRLIILDYDGTLKKFVKSTGTIAGAPSLRARRVIKQLADSPNTTVAIVSGRPRKILSRWFAGMKVVQAAEHGAWTKFGKKWEKIDGSFSTEKRKIQKIMAEYVDKTEGSFIEEKDFAMVWHCNGVEPDLAYKRVQELRQDLKVELEDDNISVDIGHNIVEVKPQAVNKGNVVHELQRLYKADFVLCAGDDYTDEDMFAALDDEVATTIKIGGGETRARYQLETVSQTLDLLSSLLPQTGVPLVALTTKIPSRTKSLLKRLFN